MSDFIISPSTIYSKKEYSGMCTGYQEFHNLTSELIITKIIWETWKNKMLSQLS